MNARIGILAFALTLSLHAMENTSPRCPSEGKEEVDLPSALAVHTEASSHSSALALGSDSPYAWPERVRKLTPAQRERFAKRFAASIAASSEQTMTDSAVGMRLMETLYEAELSEPDNHISSRQPSHKKLTELIALKYKTDVKPAVFVPRHNKVIAASRFEYWLSQGTKINISCSQSGRELDHSVEVASSLNRDDLAVNNDGTTVAIMGDIGKFHLWDMNSDKCHSEFGRGILATTNSLSFNKQGNLIVAPAGGWVNIHDVRTKECAQSLCNRAEILSSPFSTAAFNPHGNEIAATCRNRIVHVWDVRSERKRLHLDQEGSYSTKPKAIFSPQGNLIASIGETDVNILDAQTGRKVRILLPHAHDVVRTPKKPCTIYDISFSPDGNTLAVACDQSVELIDVKSGLPGCKIEYINTDGTPTFNSVRFNDDGSQLVTTANDGSVRIWAVEDEKPEDTK